ncbi:MAG TPA: glycosyltransferase [bacterium]|nr:glycosyltransferase [bacterium]HPR87885.1 glycosyltransferase [bacterium]
MSAAQVELSVIIPARDRLDVLRRVLAALAAQELDPHRFEVLVIDDGGGDGTLAYLQGRAAALPFAMVTLQGRGEGAAAARNLAAAASRGRVLLFLDADTIPAAPLLAAHLALHPRGAAPACHMGRIEMSDELRQPGQARWHELELRADDPASGEIGFRRYRTANTSMPHRIFAASGGFDERLQAAEDLELAYRLARRGLRFYYHPEIIAVHHHPLSLAEYYGKGRLYGQAVARWLAAHPEHRLELARRFGLYDAGLAWRERCRYGLKILLVNRISVRLLSALGQGCRRGWFAASQRLFKAAYGYYLRRSFSTARLQPDLHALHIGR